MLRRAATVCGAALFTGLRVSHGHCAQSSKDQLRAEKDVKLYQDWKRWSDHTPDDETVVAALRPFEDSKEWLRIDQMGVKKFGISAIKGNVLIDSLALKADAIKMHRMYMKADASEVALVVEFGRGTTGHAGVVHGGLTAMLFDNTMGWMTAVTRLAEIQRIDLLTDPNTDAKELADTTKTFGFTAYLNINYRSPLFQKSKVAVLRAGNARVENRKLYLTATLASPSGKLYADAETLYVQPRQMEK